MLSTQAQAEPTLTEKHEFKAETKMLLDIVARSLYSEKEIFIRELISNASDALEKLRYLQISSAPETAQTSQQLEIRLKTDKFNHKFTIEDTGVGMTKQELIDNLGTIAKSGSKAFLNELKSKNAPSTDSIIGQFGVGFYSAFMVASKIDVFSKSYLPNSTGYHWTSDGAGSYEINEDPNVEQGTKIILHLKANEVGDFGDEVTVKNIIQKYSNFINCPIYLNDERINAVQALWTMDPKDVDEKMHEKFYQFINHNEHDKPRFKLHYKTDAPVNIRCLLYVPFNAPANFDLSQDVESGVALYSRRVLIQQHSKDVLPRWLRFLKGVVDSEDVPLNLSRELLQQTAVLNKIRQALTGRMLKFLQDLSKKDVDNYKYFYSKYSLFFKEGILRSTDQVEKEDIAKLLMFESSDQRPGVQVSLTDYCSRMQAGQRDIFYLCAPSRQLAETSPYFEVLKKRNVEVLFCYEPYDEVTMLQLRQFDMKNITCAEKGASDYDHKTETEEIKPDSNTSDVSPTIDSEPLMKWLKDTLGIAKVTDIKVSKKLENHPCLISVPDMSSARFFLQSQSGHLGLSEEQKYLILKPVLEINPNHAIIKQLDQLRTSDEKLAAELAEIVYDNAMISAGLMDSARAMVPKLNSLISKLLEKREPVDKVSE